MTRPTHAATPLARRFALATLVVRRRRLVLLAWLAALAVLAPLAARVESRLDVVARVDGSESLAVEEVLRERFDSPFARYAVLVIGGMPAPDTPPGRALLREIVDSVVAVPGVTGTLSFLDAEDPLFAADSARGTFVIAGIDAGVHSPDAMVAPLRATTARLAATLSGAHPGLRLRWTGDIVLNHDIRVTSAEQARTAESRALPLTLAMLVVAGGSVVAALLPVAAGVVAIVAALGLAAVAAAHASLSILLVNVVSMIGLGLGIDYSLLITSRFREERAAGADVERAALQAAEAAGHTIVLSGAAVLIGFLALALIPLNELRAVAVGGVLVVSCAVLVALTLLPALLATLGDRVERGRLPGPRRAHAVKPETTIAERRWTRWARAVVARPWLVLLLGGAPLLLLALQARRLDTALPRAGWLPATMESASALAELERMGRAGVVQRLRVLVEVPPGMSVLEGDGWRAVARTGRAIAADPRIDRVQSLPTTVHSDEPSLTLLGMQPAAVVRSLASRDQRVALLEVLPRSDVDFPELTRLVRELRTRDADTLTGVVGARVAIGGMSAFNADYEDAIARGLPLVVSLVLGGTLLALLAGFRSVLVPLKALALNLLSVGAALGAVVLVFQDGYGAGALGLDGGMGSLFPALPALVFCIVFGLSMDYEVFLVARVAEARRRGLDERAAIVEGVVRTGRVITGAAAVMLVVFAAFTLGEFLMIKVLGFALAVAVLVDATVVRLALGPALLVLAGRWNWWPGERPATARVPGAPVRTRAGHGLHEASGG